jgi:hypothetical protein
LNGTILTISSTLTPVQAAGLLVKAGFKVKAHQARAQERLAAAAAVLAAVATTVAATARRQGRGW